jgi:hypothetical protein
MMRWELVASLLMLLAPASLPHVPTLSAQVLALRRLLPLPEDSAARAAEITARYVFIDGHADVPMQVRADAHGRPWGFGLHHHPTGSHSLHTLQ